MHSFVRQFGVIFLIAVLFCVGRAVMAEGSVESELYVAEVELVDSLSATRTQAFNLALGKVLIKLSGVRDILEAPETEKLLNQASRYVRTYSIEKAIAEQASAEQAPEEQSVPDIEPDQDIEAEPVPSMILRVEFDGPALERALVAAGLPVWSGSRVTTLVWLAVAEGRERFIIADGADSEILNGLQRAAMDRGLPIRIPLMDQADSQNVAYIDVRGGFLERLKLAAERYNTPVLLVGTLQAKGEDSWSAKWTVIRENVTSSWLDTDLPLSQVIQSGIDGLGDILVSRYAFVSAPGGQSSDYYLVIDNIMSLEHYAKLIETLQNLVFVGNVTPVRVQDTEVKIRLRMRGSIQELQRALSLQVNLKPGDTVLTRRADRAVPDQNYINSSEQNHSELYYSWNP